MEDILQTSLPSDVYTKKIVSDVSLETNEILVHIF
jgi:hypothetical protein